MASYRPEIKTGNTTTTDFPIDAETVKGHAVETTGISSNTDTLPTTAQVKAYVDANAGGGGSGGITEISTQYIRVSDLETGVYKLTYAGEKYLYYKGLTNTTTISISAHSGAILFYVEKYNIAETYYWKWWYLARGATSANYMTITYGSTRSNAGLYESQDLTTIAHTNLLKTINGNNITGTGNINTLYLHLIEVYYRNSGLSMYFRIFSSKATAYSLSEIRSLFESNKLGNLSIVYNGSSGTINNENGYVVNDTSDEDYYCLKFRFTSSATVSWWDYQDSVSSLDITDNVYTL